MTSSVGELSGVDSRTMVSLGSRAELLRESRDEDWQWSSTPSVPGSILYGDVVRTTSLPGGQTWSTLAVADQFRNRHSQRVPSSESKPLVGRRHAGRDADSDCIGRSRIGTSSAKNRPNASPTVALGLSRIGVASLSATDSSAPSQSRAGRDRATSARCSWSCRRRGCF